MPARRIPLLCLLVAACSSDPSAPPEASYSIAIRAGSAQQGPAGSVLANPLEVTVTNVANEPVQGVVVGFRALEGGGSLVDSVGVTALGGVATAFARLGGAQGPHRFSAFLRAAPEKAVVFEANATPPAVLSAVQPATFAAEDTIEVIGENFNTSLSGNNVLFGEHRGRVIAAENGTLIRVIVPACLSAGAIGVRVEVGSATTNTVQGTYQASSPVLSLAVGQALTVDAAELGECLLLESAGPRYLVVPQFAVAAPSPTSTAFEIGRAPPPIPLRVSTLASPVYRRGSAQARLDAFMRGVEREIAAEAAVQVIEPRADLTGTPPLNSTRSFRAISLLGDPGESPEFTTVTAQLKFSGVHVLIYVDQLTMVNLSDADLARVGTLFDTRLYEIAVSAFGSESDLDGNGKIIVLMSPSVNGLSIDPDNPNASCSSTGFVAGYFYPNDLLVRNANSNRGEIFYTLVPDPTAEFSNCAHEVGFVRRFIPTTFIHELQHMISFNQHVLARGGSTEDVWLNEGLSLIAEELGGRFYEVRGDPPAPGQPYSDSTGIFLTDVLENAYDYLFASRSYSVTTFRDFGSLEERGAAWLFLRWLGTQKGDTLLYRRLVQTKSTGIDNVEDKAGESFAALFGDFSIAAAADVPPVIARASLDPRFRFDRDFRALFSFIQQAFSKPAPSPVNYTFSPPSPNEVPIDGTLYSRQMVPGTMSFFSFRTALIPETATGLRFTAPGSAPFSPALRAQVGIVRVQ